jgi:hypothetical protein
MSHLIKVEALIATPPTRRCEEMIQILEKLIMRHPDDLRLVVFKRGVDFMPEELRLAPAEADQETKEQGASIQMRILIRKGSVVPACVLNGVVFCAAEVPNLDELEAKVSLILHNQAGIG